MLRSIKKVALAILFATICVVAPDLFAQASVYEHELATVYVDANAGSDSNPGTSAKPFLTIGGAARVALANNLKNIGTKVLINPGTYRETLAIGSTDDETTSAITFQAVKTGTAIISASDVMTGWTPASGHPSIYTHAWNYNFGACALPSGWPTNLPPILMRSEMLFVNSLPLTQVISASQLVMGTFYVDESTHEIEIWPVSGTDMSTALVETAVRPNTLTVYNRSNMVFRGLTFQHARSCLNFDGAVVTSSVNMLFDSVQANWNNFGGLGINTSTQITVESSVASHNGAVGFGSYRTLNALYQYDEADYNNWRGAMGGFYDWAMGGFKLSEMHAATFDKVYAYRNQAEGLWFDEDGENITINGATLVENDSSNMQLEIDEGPVWVSGSTLCNSNGSGATLLNSAYTTLTNNKFYNNGDGVASGHAEIFVMGQEGGVTIKNWQTGLSGTYGATNVSMTNNVFQNNSPGQTLFGTYLVDNDWTKFVATLQSSGNQWYDPTGKDKFILPVNKMVDLVSFQSATGQDSASTFAPSPVPTGCAVPDPIYSDYTLSADHREYTMVKGKATINLAVKSYGWNTVYLGGLELPAGVSASFSATSLTSGSSVLMLTANRSAKSETVHLTIFGQSKGRVHPVTVVLVVVPSGS